MKITVTLENLTAEELVDVGNRLKGLDSSSALAMQNIERAISESETPTVQSPEQFPFYDEYNDGDLPVESTASVDAEGLPWDERIHSSNRKMTAKGVWVRRRGSQDFEYDAVKNELLGQTAPAPVAPVAAPAPVRDYNALVARISAGIAGKTINIATITQMNASIGVTNLPDIVNSPSHVEAAHAFLDAAAGA